MIIKTSSKLVRQLLHIGVAGSILAGQALPYAASHDTQSVVSILTQKAQALEARDRDDLAAQVWRQVLVADPSNSTALAHLAQCATQAGHAAEAKTYLERLHQLAPGSGLPGKADSLEIDNRTRTRLDEAAHLATDHRPEEAMQIYREVFGDNPPSGRWAMPYYETLAGTPGGGDAAVRGMRDLVSKYPTVPEYRASLGKLLTYSQATRQAGIAILSEITGSTHAAAEARLAWRQALVWEKLNTAYASSAKLYLSRYPDAELAAVTAKMREQAELHPTQSPAATEEEHKQQLGYAALKAGDLSGAEHSFESVSENSAANGRAQAGLGFVAMRKGDFREAVQHFTAAAKLPGAPESVHAGLQDATFWDNMDRASKALEMQHWEAAVGFYNSALSIKPSHKDALIGLGGALLAADKPAKAILYLTKAVHEEPSMQRGWMLLAKATLATSGGQPTLKLMASVPEGVASALASHPEWEAVEALAYQDAGESSKAQSIYRSIVQSDTGALPADVQTQLAALALQLHEPSQAAVYARRAIESGKADSGAWEILVSALVTAGHPDEAQLADAHMPSNVRTVIAQHPGYRETLAALKEANRDLEGALALLEPLSQSDKGAATDAQISLKLHVADLNAKLGHTEQAELMLNELSEAQPNNLSIWRARLQLLNQLKKPSEIVSLSAQIPQDVALKLGHDGDVVALLASANAAIGRRDYAVRFLESYLLLSPDKDAPTVQQRELQLGWLLLDTPNAGGRLYRVLENLDGSGTLAADQKKQLTDLWTTWILRSSDAAKKAGDVQRAMTLLETGNQRFPNNPSMQKALAGALLASGDTKRALNFYSNWGLSGADADDYAGAIGAALSQNNTQYAGAWLQTALVSWPANPKILTLAGDLSQSRGDLKHAKLYWQQALAVKQAQLPSASSNSPEDNTLKAMLVGVDGTLPEAAASDMGVNVQPSDAAPSMHAPVPVRLSSYRGETATQSAPALAPLTAGLGVNPLVKTASQPDPNSLEDKLASLESRNTPYLNSQMSVWGRGGQSGFDRLFIEQADFEASTTLANNLRASMLLKPTFLSGGTPDGSGTALFGRQTTTQSFGPQSASGVAGEVQLSSDPVGIRIGATPRGFLTNNWVGGFRLRPNHGHITLLLERDDVRDTLLSYAGVKDPITRQISGGVMTNTGSVQGQWGSATSGAYASLGYQTLDGRNVARNTAANGNLGTWWKVGTLYGGNVTVGMNFSGMGYDRNLRYFTFGQGGYFSPQQYFLFNVPVRWAGNYGPVHYAVSGSYGLQHFTEDTSDYYPNDAALQATSKQLYPALVVTGANFNLDARVAYQMAPHWMVGAFVTASNARDYTAASGGVFAKYTFEERPMTFVQTAPSIPDWRGQQPFSF